MTTRIEEVKAAAERKMKGPIGLEEQNTLAYFALAAIPAIEAAEESMRVYDAPTLEQGNSMNYYAALQTLRAALAKLRESE